MSPDQFGAGRGPEGHPPVRLTVDLAALAANWKALDAMSADTVTTAGVVKANAYGLGAAVCAPALAAAGCTVFFVATPTEGAEVRGVLPDATIYVLDGLPVGGTEWLAARNLRPVLNSLAEISEWRAARDRGVTTTAAIHVDTGMNRLGLRPGELASLADDSAAIRTLGIDHLMGHLACADMPDHPTNETQLTMFRALRQRLPDLTASLANTAGIGLGPDHHFDLVRPGIGLYGGSPTADPDDALAPVATAEAVVLQVREADEGETVGYGAAASLDRARRIAILGAGYADGYHRLAGSSDERPGAEAFVRGARAPLIGRVSMDLIAVDVTDVPGVERGDMVELFGPNIPVDEVAARAQTIGYELLTSLGRRYARTYIGG